MVFPIEVLMKLMHTSDHLEAVNETADALTLITRLS